jgi:hypothetical protein
MAIFSEGYVHLLIFNPISSYCYDEYLKTNAPSRLKHIGVIFS